MMSESNAVAIPNSPGPATKEDRVHESNNQGAGIDFAVRNAAAGIVSSISNNADLANGVANVAHKLGSFKKTVIASYKTTKHSVYEHLGKVERTVDTELDGEVEALRELHRRYHEVLATARAHADFFAQSSNMQRNLSEALGQLASKEDSLNRELTVSGEMILSMHKNGEHMVRALNNFVSSIDVLTTKTIEDTLLTIEKHDQARLEYDIARYEWDNQRKNPNALPQAIDDAEKECKLQLEKYGQLKEDVRVKLTLLEENRCKVVRKQLTVMQEALHAYFSSSLQTLDGYSLRTTPHSTSNPSHDDDDDPMGSRAPLSHNSASFLEK